MYSVSHHLPLLSTRRIESEGEGREATQIRLSLQTSADNLDILKTW